MSVRGSGYNYRMAHPFDEDPVRRRKRSDAALNRGRIIEVAQQVLSGNERASMAEIAGVAKLGRGTLYRHFPTRAALLDAVRAQAREDREANQDDHLRPPGELAGGATPLSITDVLAKVPPHQLGEQIVAEAQRIAGVTAAALYLVDLDGSLLLRLAGPRTFPERIRVPLAVGPEIPRIGIEPLRARVEEKLPGAVLAPLYLRGSAIGVILALGEADDRLRDLAAEAAGAISLAERYTDTIDNVRRDHPPSPAAEVQQNLLPPRVMRIAGAQLAGNVLPGYDIGGDWFDYAENDACAWLGIADVAGIGPRAGALSSVLLGAFRAARHGDRDLPGAALLMHEVMLEIGLADATAAAIIGSWNAPSSTLRWLSFGPVRPVLLPADGGGELALGESLPLLGDAVLKLPDDAMSRQLDAGDRVLFASDGVTEATGEDGAPFGLAAVASAARSAASNSAAATVRAVEDAARAHVGTRFLDDATVVCLAC